MAKTLRVLNDGRFNTKNDELSFPELDTNFIEMQDDIDDNAQAILAITIPTEGGWSADGAALVLTLSGQALTFSGVINAYFGYIIETDGGDFTKIIIAKDGIYEFNCRLNLAITTLGNNEIENLHFYLKVFNADDLDNGEILKMSYLTKEYSENNPQVVINFMVEPAYLFQIGEIVRVYCYRSGDGETSFQAVNPSVPDPDLGATVVTVAPCAMTITTLVDTPGLLIEP